MFEVKKKGSQNIEYLSNCLMEIEGIEMFAYHGCTDSEKVVGTNFSVDIAYKYDTKEAETKDKIELTVNYQEIVEIVHKQMNEKSNLIEHVCNRIFEEIKTKYASKINYLKVVVSKKNPPIKGIVKNVKFTKEDDIKV